VKYIILTLGNPEREHYRASIREAMAGYEEVKTRAVNGKDPDDLNDAIRKWGFDINFEEWKPGEGGVWFSNIFAWEYIANQREDVVVFEDDAILHPDFRRVVDLPAPKGHDFLTYYQPYRSYPNLLPIRGFVPTFQQHGMVCIRYSPLGARRALNILEAHGIEWPVDIWIFKQAIQFKRLRGYSPKEVAQIVVDVDLEAVPSNIHQDERIAVYKPERTM
jgi:GR25 family glycosyltransferase involved in LPS biosynthesis